MIKVNCNEELIKMCKYKDSNFFSEILELTLYGCEEYYHKNLISNPNKDSKERNERNLISNEKKKKKNSSVKKKFLKLFGSSCLREEDDLEMITVKNKNSIIVDNSSLPTQTVSHKNSLFCDANDIHDRNTNNISNIKENVIDPVMIVNSSSYQIEVIRLNGFIIAFTNTSDSSLRLTTPLFSGSSRVFIPLSFSSSEKGGEGNSNTADNDVNISDNNNNSYNRVVLEPLTPLKTHPVYITNITETSNTPGDSSNTEKDIALNCSDKLNRVTRGALMKSSTKIMLEPSLLKLPKKAVKDKKDGKKKRSSFNRGEIGSSDGHNQNIKLSTLSGGKTSNDLASGAAPPCVHSATTSSPGLLFHTPYSATLTAPISLKPSSPTDIQLTQSDRQPAAPLRRTPSADLSISSASSSTSSSFYSAGSDNKEKDSLDNDSILLGDKFGKPDGGSQQHLRNPTPAKQCSPPPLNRVSTAAAFADNRHVFVDKNDFDKKEDISGNNNNDSVNNSKDSGSKVTSRLNLKHLTMALATCGSLRILEIRDLYTCGDERKRNLGGGSIFAGEGGAAGQGVSADISAEFDKENENGDESSNARHKTNQPDSRGESQLTHEGEKVSKPRHKPQKLALNLQAISGGSGANGCSIITGLRDLRAQLLELEVQAINDGFWALAAVMPYSPARTSLAELILVNCKIRDESMAMLATMLPEMPSLKVLDLKDNLIGVSGVKALSGSLPHCLSLEVLDLAGNVLIGSRGTVFIAEAISDMCTLRRLYLRNINMRTAGVVYLAPALVQCVSLEFISLKDNHIDHIGIRALRRYLCAGFGCGTTACDDERDSCHASEGDEEEQVAIYGCTNYIGGSISRVDDDSYVLGIKENDEGTNNSQSRAVMSVGKGGAGGMDKPLRDGTDNIFFCQKIKEDNCGDALIRKTKNNDGKINGIGNISEVKKIDEFLDNTSNNNINLVKNVKEKDIVNLIFKHNDEFNDSDSIEVLGSNCIDGNNDDFALVNKKKINRSPKNITKGKEDLLRSSTSGNGILRSKSCSFGGRVSFEENKKKNNINCSSPIGFNNTKRKKINGIVIGNEDDAIAAVASLKNIVNIEEDDNISNSVNIIQSSEEPGSSLLTQNSMKNKRRLFPNTDSSIKTSVSKETASRKSCVNLLSLLNFKNKASTSSRFTFFSRNKYNSSQLCPIHEDKNNKNSAINSRYEHRPLSSFAAAAMRKRKISALQRKQQEMIKGCNIINALDNNNHEKNININKICVELDGFLPMVK